MQCLLGKVDKIYSDSLWLLCMPRICVSRQQKSHRIPKPKLVHVIMAEWLYGSGHFYYRGQGSKHQERGTGRQQTGER